MNDTVLMIAVTDIRPACAGESDLTQRLDKAFRQARRFWLSTDENLRFKAAVVAVTMETTDEEEKTQIEWSSRMLYAYARLCGGGSVEELPEPPPEIKLLPLIKMWRETA